MAKNLIYRFLPLFIILLLTLGGCVRYDVGVNFTEQHHGTIVQRIHLGQQLTSLSGLEARKWLNSLDERAKQLQGSVKRISDADMQITIPFNSGKDLVDKFNQFFNPTEDKPKQTKQNQIDLLPIKATIQIRQSNWLFFERDRLNLTVDLQGLGVLSQQGNIIVSPGDLIDLQFILTTPWGAKSLLETTENVTQNGQQLIWKLQPGQVNVLDTAFLVPSYLTWGTIAIIAFCILGFFVKYKRLPGGAVNTNS
ncbi:MAG: DUF3153 domain-containing protein [Microcystaceae cyanobacterium]